MRISVYLQVHWLQPYSHSPSFSLSSFLAFSALSFPPPRPSFSLSGSHLQSLAHHCMQIFLGIGKWINVINTNQSSGTLPQKFFIEKINSVVVVGFPILNNSFIVTENKRGGRSFIPQGACLLLEPKHNHWNEVRRHLHRLHLSTERGERCWITSH